MRSPYNRGRWPADTAIFRRVAHEIPSPRDMKIGIFRRVAHELAITTADEKRLAIFSRVVMPHGGTMMHEKGPELASAKACM